MEQAVARAMQAVAYGSSLRSAAKKEDAPYTSVHKAWKALDGDTKGPAWRAYVASLPPAPATADPASRRLRPA